MLSLSLIVFWGVELPGKLSLFVAETLYSCMIQQPVVI